MPSPIRAPASPATAAPPAALARIDAPDASASASTMPNCSSQSGIERLPRTTHEAAAKTFEARVYDAVEHGARVLYDPGRAGEDRPQRR